MNMKQTPDGALSRRDEEVVSKAETLGRALRAARLQMGLTQESVALRVGLVRKTIYSLESGKLGVSLGAALLVAHELNVTSALAALGLTPPVWEPLTPAVIKRLEAEDSATYWIATKTGRLLSGIYEWRQGYDPEGFYTNEFGRVGVKDVSHVMRFVPPTLPALAS